MPGYPDNQYRARHWMPCENMSGEEIPSFAVMMMHNYDRDGTAYGAFERGGEILWKLDKCNELMEEDQNPACLFFNGAKPIPVAGFGECTRHFPARVMHNGNEDALMPAVPCGPKADDWNIWSTGDAFQCMGHNKADYLIEGVDKQHTVWVTNERLETNAPWGCFGGPSQTVNPQAAQQFTLASAGLENPATTTGGPFEGIRIGGDNAEAGFFYRVTKKANRVLVTFNGTVYAGSGVVRGTKLSVTIMHKRDGEELARFIGWREQVQESAWDGVSANFVQQITKENIAIIGQFVDLRKDDEIILKNESSETITIDDATFNVTKLASGFSVPPEE